MGGKAATAFDLSGLLGQVDVAFVVDTTGSMGPFIDAARQHAREIAARIAAAGDLDLRFAVVEYRDHPPEEQTFVTRVYPFVDGAAFQAALDTLQPAGGGDAPEAVLDGLVAAARLDWRPRAERLGFLVGDAPPHGMASTSADRFPHGCPCRATANGVVELLRGSRITLHSILLSADVDAQSAFRELAEAAGGTYTHAPHAPERAVHTTGAVLHSTSMTVDAARAYMSAAAEVGSAAPAPVAARLGWTKEMASGVASYLARRGVLRDDKGDTPA